MKSPRMLTGFLLLLVPAIAADPAALRFGGERIGVPPLSLAENMPKNPSGFGKHPFPTTLPKDSTAPELPRFSPKLVPPSNRVVPPKSSSRLPRVDRAARMPILIPSEAVGYAMKVIPPDPNVDFKLVIKDPGKDPRAPTVPDFK